MSGLFNNILGELAGGLPAGAGYLVSELVARAGGVSGILQKFNQAGLGDKAASWASHDPNIPLAAEEVLKVFPQDQLEQLAEKHGVPPGMVTGVLAHLLPQAVNQAGVQPGSEVAPGETGQV